MKRILIALTIAAAVVAMAVPAYAGGVIRPMCGNDGVPCWNP